MADEAPLKLYLLLLLVGAAALWAVFVIGEPEPRHYYEAERLSFEDGEFETTNLATGEEGGEDTYDMFGRHREVHYCEAVDTPACILLIQTSPTNATVPTNTTADPPPLETEADLLANYVYYDAQFYAIDIDRDRFSKNVTLDREPANEALKEIAWNVSSEPHLTAIRTGSVTTDEPILREGDLLVYDDTLYRIRYADWEQETDLFLRQLRSALMGILGGLSVLVGVRGLLRNRRRIWKAYGVSL